MSLARQNFDLLNLLLVLGQKIPLVAHQLLSSIFAAIA